MSTIETDQPPTDGGTTTPGPKDHYHNRCDRWHPAGAVCDQTGDLIRGDGKDARELAWDFESGRRGETWFSAQLFHLIIKADLANRARLAYGFPEYVAFVEAWNRTENGERWLMDMIHSPGRKPPQTP